MDWPKTLNVKGFVYGVVGAKSSLKREGNATADGPGGLDHIDGLAILAEDGNVSLRQEVAQVDDGFHMAAHAGKRLAGGDGGGRTKQGRATKTLRKGSLCPGEALNISTGVIAGPLIQR